MNAASAAPPERRPPSNPVNRVQRMYKRSRLRRFIRRRKDATTYHLARFALWLPRQISLTRAMAAADCFGDLLYFALPETRRLALAHLEIAFGDSLDVSAREEIARAALRNAARCFVELAKFDEIGPQFDAYTSVEGWQHLEAVRDLGRGAIVITGHIGNWELLGGYFARKGVPIAAMARPLNDPRLNQLLVDFRTSNGVHSIMRESSTSSRDMLRILNRRGVLAMLIDQDMITPSVSVPFFGRPARTAVAPAVLAVRRDLPVVPCFAERRPEGGQRFMIMPPIFPSHSGDRTRDIVEITRRATHALEERIRANPAEWTWWIKRWRRPPVARLDLDSEIQ